MITRGQLLAEGFAPEAIRHRLSNGRLHRIHRGVYAVGRRALSREGEFMAAVLACGAGALLSHESAAEHMAIRRRRRGPIEVTVPAGARRTVDGIRVHRSARADGMSRGGIPVTTPGQTLIDLARRLPRNHVEAAINEADILGLINLKRLAADAAGRRDAVALRRVVCRYDFRLTRSELERKLLPIAARAGLGPGLTRAEVNGLEVDFYWPALGLVVETDGGRFHRTPAQQKRDRERDQTHSAAGLIPLRFTHGQVEFEPVRVERILRQVGSRAWARAG